MKDEGELLGGREASERDTRGPETASQEEINKNKECLYTFIKVSQ